jgi:hypothetical protein
MIELAGALLLPGLEELEEDAAVGGEEGREDEGLHGHELDEDVERRPRRVCP